MHGNAVSDYLLEMKKKHLAFYFQKGLPTVFLLMYVCPCISLYEDGARSHYATAQKGHLRTVRRAQFIIQQLPAPDI